MTHVTVRNGLTLAYTIAFVNATLALLIAFGVSLSDTQQATIVTFVNAAILLAARVLHLPERTATGTVKVTHVPVLTETDDHAPEVPPVTVA
jgi:hypothetical protein